MRITFLGTGAPLHPTRRTLGLLVQTDAGGDPLLVDTCGGFELAHALNQANQPGDTLKHAIITHRHGDHIAGAMPLLLLTRGMTYHGPGDALDAIDRLIHLTYPHLAAPEDRRPTYAQLPERTPVEIHGYSVTAFPVDHRVPTLAIRIERDGRVLAFSADSRPCDALIECARGADLFVCDALCDEASASRAADLMHPTASQAASIARDAGARALGLVHAARFANEPAMLAEARAVFLGEVFMPDDGATHTITAD